MGGALDDEIEQELQGSSSMRVLDEATRAAMVAEVDAAKQRGWLQPDLRRWFKARDIELATYAAAKAGQGVPRDAASVFAQISITGLPHHPYAANPDDIRGHIGWLTMPARGTYDDALFEIAYDGEGRGPSNARLFGLDEIEAAIRFAMERNHEGRNIYIGAALKLPETDRTKRSNGDDFYVATAVPIDIDHDYDATRARMATVCDDGLVVTTGMTPERRSQHWTQLSEPCDDDLAFEHAFASLVAHTGADMKVKDKARIMRLGGTVSFPEPRKQSVGYCTELTSVTVSRTARYTDIATLQALAPYEGGGQRFDASGRPAGTGIEREGLMGSGRVKNGRETHFRDLLLKHIRKFQDEHGADPDATELWDAAYGEFSDPALVDNDDQRWTSLSGQRELHGRLINTIRRLRSGRLARSGLWSRETGVGEEEAEAVQANRRPFVDRIEEAAQAAKEDERVATGLVATPYKWIAPSQIPPRDLLYGRHFFRKFLSVTVSPGGLGKSSNAIVEALAMVTGRTLIGEAPKGELRVWYWNGEDPHEELQRRIQAACIQFEITEADLGGRLFVDSGRDTEITIAREDRDGFQIAVPVVDALIATIRDRQIDTLIVDPFVASHAVSENDNTKIEGVVRQWMRVAEVGGCAVELVHHVRKPGGGASQETTVDDARGAGALLAKARSARVLNGMSIAEADEVGVDRKDRWRFFRIDNGKANLMPRGGEARWRQMVGVPLGNRIDTQEDEIGVATEWQRPSVFVGMKEHHLPAVRAAVEAGDWRLDVQCQNWVGVAVAGALGVDPSDPKEKARIKSMVSTWIKNDVLRVVNQLDPNRRMRPFVIVGKDAE